ncbi:transposase, partial [Motilimonas sp. KMU-193]|uniref:transposase n=1 Tax=Motilimonas sp. KMU-193 TaxID=3388668 RepID=UPI00396B42B2
LPTLKFLMLILQHVLPKGLQRARDYGYLRGNAKAILQQIQCLLLPLLQLLLGLAPLAKPERTCPCCQHTMKCTGISRLR